MQSRPMTLTRPPVTSTTQSVFSSRQSHSHSRNSSHSIATGPSHNASHRVSRRKSMTSTGPNREAIAAALKLEPGALPIAGTPRARAVSKGSRPLSPPLSLPAPAHKCMPLPLPVPVPLQEGKSVPAGVETNNSAVDDEQISGDEATLAFQNARIRRASDGQPLAKDGRKANRVELRCEKCGKGYKHSSCLTKHLWEHTPEWSYTSKLLISKHQQVQLLEAASVLVAMNNRPSGSEAVTPPDSAKGSPAMGSEESNSPAASGYSAHRDGGGRSSADTTPPPHPEVEPPLGPTYYSKEGQWKPAAFLPKVYTSSSSGLARSLQPPQPSSVMTGPGSAPNGSNISNMPNIPNSSVGSTGLGHFRQLSLSHDRRPPSSGMNRTGRDDRDLAATLEMLSCSVGSNTSHSLGLPVDAPPVPPLPAQYLGQSVLSQMSPYMGSFPTQPESFMRGGDVKMDEGNDSTADDDDFDRRSRARSDEDDDGVFGRMEE